MTQVTIKDLALNLGLSTSTISRALRNHPDINIETKKLVRAAALKLGYEPNIVARNLKTKYSNQIGIIIPEIKHDFFSKAISGIEEVAYNAGFTVIVSQSNEDEEREKINTNALYLHRVAGFIVSLSQTTQNIDHFKILIEKGVKIVFFDRVWEEDDLYKVVIDDFKASKDAVSHLISKGNRRIVHLAGPQILQNCRGRFEGYKEALEEAGIPFDENLVLHGGMHEDDGLKSIKQLIAQNIEFDSIFAVNDPVAVGATLYLKKMGIEIPGKVSIVGFSNNPITEYMSPSLTTIEQPAYEMGKKAAEVLISLIKGEDGFPEKKITLETNLIEREST
ncbi:MAG: LacI family transcriptional regulator [Melioribacteraceae bacterium]|nr:LacI family transcriptional regulator [Melioribacteraceae bacterium]MCF8263201.1 LacI family transcriptional regulator [Melioribacteraceae bacterium]MCF8412712.1 LacI family transcriptional regulator [Melioribacteraceae bacterium]MCF8431281.1 LacI family transcriptional regulator [Melioribacteraceae bacterium]